MFGLASEWLGVVPSRRDIRPMDGHAKLRVWQDARQLVVEVHAFTRELPVDERYVAVPQLRRAAWSVPNDIAEGNARRGRPQLLQFLNCALGSLGEIDSMMRVLPDLYALDAERLATVDRLRVRVTWGIFRLMRGPGRGSSVSPDPASSRQIPPHPASSRTAAPHPAPAPDASRPAGPILAAAGARSNSRSTPAAAVGTGG
jgi:four helix bundle protein